MALSSEIRQKIDVDRLGFSEHSIAKFLEERQWSLSDLADLSLYLVGEDRSDLAMKVFAKWAEVKIKSKMRDRFLNMP
jgi:hypothetical protein